MNKKELVELCFDAVHELNECENAKIDRNDYIEASKHLDRAEELLSRVENAVKSDLGLPVADINIGYLGIYVKLPYPTEDSDQYDKEWYEIYDQIEHVLYIPGNINTSHIPEIEDICKRLLATTEEPQIHDLLERLKPLLLSTGIEFDDVKVIYPYVVVLKLPTPYVKKVVEEWIPDISDPVVDRIKANPEQWFPLYDHYDGIRFPVTREKVHLPWSLY